MVEMMNCGFVPFELYTRVYGAEARSRDVVLSLVHGQDLVQASEDGESTGFLSLKATDSVFYANLSPLDDNCVHIDAANSSLLEGDERNSIRTFRLTLECSHAFFLEKYEEICK